MPPATKYLRESVGLQEGGRPRVDRAAGVIYGVKVCGLKSKHGYSYAAGALDPKLYESQRVCLNHSRPGASRSVLDTRAWLEGLHTKPDGLYAQRLCFAHPGGEDEQRLMGLAEKAPHLLALSHSAKAGRWNAGGTVVEAVAAVESVDIVERGATNATLYEGVGYQWGGKTVKVKRLVEALAWRKPAASRLLREAVEDGALGAEMDTIDPDAAGGDDETAVDTAFEQGVLACMRDDTLTPEDCMKRIRSILQARAKVRDAMGGGNGGGGGMDDGAEEYAGDGAREKVESGVAEGVPADRSRWAGWLNDDRRPRAGAGRGRGRDVQEARRATATVPADRAQWKSWLQEKGGR